MENLSAILKKRRKELGLTLAQIAEQMGVAEATVQRWESGNIKSIRYEKIDKLSEILKVSPASFMGWPDAEKSVYGDLQPNSKIEKPPAQGGEPIGPNKQALLDLVETMSDDEMGVLLEVVKATLKMRGANDR